MRRQTTAWIIVAVFGLSVVFFLFLAMAGRTESGQIISIDKGGKSFVLQTGNGKEARQINVNVSSNTRLRINGMCAPVGEIEEHVKVGDTVTVKFTAKGDDYARRIMK